jgi:GT2 family glycosyltransferase
VQRFSLDFGNMRVHTEALIDGYYVVLLTDDTVAPTLARVELARASADLRLHL